MRRFSMARNGQQPSRKPRVLRTISEAANELGLEPHVLRFWERMFRQLSPMRTGGGRRYYRSEDIELLHRIRSLLYDDGLSIKGAQRLLGHERDQPAARGDTEHRSAPHVEIETHRLKAKWQEMDDTLDELRRALALMREALH